MSGEMMKERVDNIRADLRMFSTSRGSTLSPHLSAIWSRQVPARMWLHRLKHRCPRIKQRAGRAPRCWSGAGVKRWGIKISTVKKSNRRQKSMWTVCDCVPTWRNGEHNGPGFIKLHRACGLCLTAIKILCLQQGTRLEPCHHSTSAVRLE